MAAPALQFLEHGIVPGRPVVALAEELDEALAWLVEQRGKLGFGICAHVCAFVA